MALYDECKDILINDEPPKLLNVFVHLQIAILSRKLFFLFFPSLKKASKNVSLCLLMSLND